MGGSGSGGGLADTTSDGDSAPGCCARAKPKINPTATPTPRVWLPHMSWIRHIGVALAIALALFLPLGMA